jgi:hypothetical protein
MLKRDGEFPCVSNEGRPGAMMLVGRSTKLILVRKSNARLSDEGVQEQKAVLLDLRRDEAKGGFWLDLRLSGTAALEETSKSQRK